MKRYIAGGLAAVLIAGVAVTGCSQQQVEKGTGSYHKLSYQDGVTLAHSLGKGLDGRFRREMRQTFASERMKLTDEKFTEDNRGNTSYQYLINSQPLQNITVHVFSSRSELLNKIPHWYGGEQRAETSTTRTEIYNKGNTSLVYTSMGKEKGKYSKQVKRLFTGLLDRLAAK